MSPDTLQLIFTPIRLYYYLMRWYFGEEYDPFETHVTEGFHPIIGLMVQCSFITTPAFFIIQYILPTIFIIYILNYLFQIKLKHSFYLHSKSI